MHAAHLTKALITFLCSLFWASPSPQLASAFPVREEGDRFTFKLACKSGGKPCVEFVVCVLGRNRGYCVAHENHICEWDLRTNSAVLLDNMLVPFQHELQPRPFGVTRIPAPKTIICDELLLELELLSGGVSCANAVREALVGTWRHSGSKVDAPFMQSELVIDSLQRSHLPLIPFDRLVVKTSPDGSTSFGSIELVSHTMSEKIEGVKLRDMEHGHQTYAESMLILMGYNGGKTKPTNHSDSRVNNNSHTGF